MINSENLPTYYTIMAVAAGAGLVMVVRLGRSLLFYKEPDSGGKGPEVSASCSSVFGW